MKSIMRVALLFVCLIPACGGKAEDDHAIGDTGAISATGGSSQDETGGTSNATTSTTAWASTGGSSPINSTSTLNTTGGSTSDTTTGGSSAVQTTASTGGTSSVSTTSATTGGTNGILHLLEPAVRELPGRTILPGEKDVTVFEFTLSAEQRNIRIPRLYVDVDGSIKNDELMPVTIVDEANNVVATENPTPFGEVYTFREYGGAFWFTPFTVDASAPPKTFRVKTGIETTAQVGKTFRFGIDTSTNLSPMVDDPYEVRTCNLGIYGSRFTVVENPNTNNGTGGATSVSATGGASSTGGSSTTGGTSSTGGGTTSSECTPHLEATSLLYQMDAFVPPGTQNATTLQLKFSAKCKDTGAKKIVIMIQPDTKDAFNTTQSGEPITTIDNIYIVNNTTGATLAGPVRAIIGNPLHEGYPTAYAILNDTFSIPVDSPITATVKLNVSSSAPLGTSYRLKLYELTNEFGTENSLFYESYTRLGDHLGFDVIVTDTPLVVSLSKDTPKSQIIVSGTTWGSWYTFSDYVVKNRGTVPQTIASITVSGLIANFITVNVSVCANNYPAGAGLSNYAPNSWITLADGSPDPWHPNTSAHFVDDASLLFDLTQGTARTILNPNEEVHLCVIGTPSAIRTEAQDAETPGRDPRSGDQIYLKISDLTNSEGTHALIEDPNITSACSSAGCVMAAMAAFKPSLMTLRKAKPIVSILPLPTTTLTNGQNTFFKFKIATDSNGGPIKFAQFDVKYEKTENVTVSNFRVFRNNVELVIGKDLWVTHYPGSNKDGNIYVTLDQETVVDVNGSTYTLVADVTNAHSGDALLSQFEKSKLTISQTGVICHPSGSNAFLFTDSTTCVANSPEMMGQRGFLWSDMSDPVNNKDWTDDFLVESLDGSSVLTY